MLTIHEITYEIYCPRSFDCKGTHCVGSQVELHFENNDPRDIPTITYRLLNELFKGTFEGSLKQYYFTFTVDHEYYNQHLKPRRSKKKFLVTPDNYKQVLF